MMKNQNLLKIMFIKNGQVIMMTEENNTISSFDDFI